MIKQEADELRSMAFEIFSIEVMGGIKNIQNITKNENQQAKGV
jgi:hypothetical protein